LFLQDRSHAARSVPTRAPPASEVTSVRIHKTRWTNWTGSKSELAHWIVVAWRPSSCSRAILKTPPQTPWRSIHQLELEAKGFGQWLCHGLTDFPIRLDDSGGRRGQPVLPWLSTSALFIFRLQSNGLEWWWLLARPALESPPIPTAHEYIPHLLRAALTGLDSCTIFVLLQARVSVMMKIGRARPFKLRAGCKGLFQNSDCPLLSERGDIAVPVRMPFFPSFSIRFSGTSLPWAKVLACPLGSP
jgi:hypothetical protein